MEALWVDHRFGWLNAMVCMLVCTSSQEREAFAEHSGNVQQFPSEKLKDFFAWMT